MSTASPVPENLDQAVELLVAERARNEELERVLEATSATYQELQQHHLAVLEELRVIRRWAFGSRRERVREAADQLHLFDGRSAGPQDACDQSADTSTQEVDGSTDVKSRRRRRRQERRLNLDALPQIEHEHDVPDSQKTCDCCGREKTCLGEDVSRVVEYQPPSLAVHVHRRKKYACRCGAAGVVSPPPPEKPLDRSIAGPGLLSALIVGKFGDHLPLYRLEDIFVRYGVHFPRSTLCDWVQSCAALLEPLYALQKKLVLKSPLLWTDDTPITFLGNDEHPGSHTGRYWAYIGDEAHPYSVYDFTTSRKRDGPSAFLAGWQGWLHADAYSGYDSIITGSGGRIIEVACWAHARRKFFEARESQPRECHQLLEAIRQLYDVEDRAAELSIDGRLALRQTESIPILERFEVWLRLYHSTALPKSAFGKAVSYALNQWDSLQTFTTDGRLSIDNNVSERTLRHQAIGRKNWLFLGSERAGNRAAVLSTILAGAKRHRLEPFAYVRDLLLHLHAEPSDLTPFLPDRWAADHPQYVLKHRLDESRRKATRKRERRQQRRLQRTEVS